MKNTALLCLALVLIAGCKKDTVSTTDEKPSAFFPSSKGSYWVYETTSYNQQQDSIYYQGTDSVVGLGDTTVNGLTYQGFITYSKPSTPVSGRISLYRDSLDYIIDLDGNILLSQQRNDTLLISSLSPAPYEQIVYMKSEDSIINLPIQTFTTLSKITKVFATDNSWSGPQQLSAHYAKGVGLVLTSYFYAAAPENRFSRKLLRYNIAQ